MMLLQTHHFTGSGAWKTRLCKTVLLPVSFSCRSPFRSVYAGIPGGMYGGRNSQIAQLGTLHIVSCHILCTQYGDIHDKKHRFFTK
jgi:hypothetical protein